LNAVDIVASVALSNNSYSPQRPWKCQHQYYFWAQTISQINFCWCC